MQQRRPSNWEFLSDTEKVFGAGTSGRFKAFRVCYRPQPNRAAAYRLLSFYRIDHLSRDQYCLLVDAVMAEDLELFAY